MDSWTTSETMLNQNVPPNQGPPLAVKVFSANLNLCQLLSSYLQRRHLNTCTQVCKAWERIFSPFLWQSLTIPTSIDKDAPSTSTFHQGMVRHQGHLSRIATRSGLVLEWLLEDEFMLSTLSSLECDSDRDAFFDLSCLMAVCKRNLELQELVVRGLQWGFTDIIPKLATPVGPRQRQLSALRKIEFSFMMRTKEIGIILDLCPLTVESLVLRAPIWYDDQDLGGKKQTGPRSATQGVKRPLKHLVLDGLVPRDIKVLILPFLSCCPNLTSFGFGGANVERGLALRLPGTLWEYCPAMRSLALYEISGSASFSLTTNLLDMSTTWKRLELSSIVAFKQASPHLGSLQYLDVSRCEGLVSGDIRSILSSCANLKYLNALGSQESLAYETIALHANDIVQADRPWVCQRLEVLHLRIVGIPEQCNVCNQETKQHTSGNLSESGNLLVEPGGLALESPSIRSAVYRQLGALTQLRELYLGRPFNSHQSFSNHNKSPAHNYSQFKDGMELCLASGLAQWSQFKNLQVLGVNRMEHHLSPKEISWMHANWPCFEELRLTLVSGTKDTDPLVHWMKNSFLDINCVVEESEPSLDHYYMR